LFLGLTIAGFAETSLVPAGNAAVFFGPMAAYEAAPPSIAHSGAPPDVLRWVWVQERMNVARPAAPVRVPVFFAGGECARMEEIALVKWPSREAIPFQADEVRRGADGGVARLHLWFVTDIARGESRRFALIKRSAPARTAAVPVRVESGRDILRVHAGGAIASFFTNGTHAARFAGLKLADGPELAFQGGAAAATGWSGARAAAPGDPRDRELSWGAGTVFAKVSIRSRDETGSAVEQVFRMFGDGSLNIVQTIMPSAETDGESLITQDFLSGRLAEKAGISPGSLSACIVDSLRDVHPGYVVDTLTSAKGGFGWLVVPGTLGGRGGRVSLDDGNIFRLHAPGGLKRASGDARAGTVRGFWSEVSLIPARRRGAGLDRAVGQAASQPLVAVVERPGVTLALATGRIQDNVREMNPVGWANQSVVRFLEGDSPPFPGRRWSVESDPERWLAEARRAYAKVTGNSYRLPAEDEKGRAAGSLDPYHITYESTALAFWMLSGELPEPIRDSMHARLEAVRRQLARTDESGWPYLDVFSRAQNMQMGPAFLTLADPAADPALRRFHRDQLAAPTVGAVMLHGFRPYEGRPQAGPSESDTLYQAVVDFYLRATELALNRSLGLQPVAFGRYLDAIDVNADLYHPAHPRAGDEGGRFARANFFRTQSHLHRWLGWGPSPFFALLASPVRNADGFVGATEAWHYANTLAGRWKNWPDQSWLFLAAILPGKAAVYSPPSPPPPAGNVKVETGEKGNRISWDPVSSAVAYRIYRLRRDSSPIWLNSPYRKDAAGEDGLHLEWLDPEGATGDRYRVHAVDPAGDESPW